MTTDSTRMHRRRFVVAAASSLLAACAGASTGGPGTAPGAAADGAGSHSPDASPSPTVSEATPSPAATQTADPAELAAQSPTGGQFPTGVQPARIEIPALGVDAPVVDLQLKADEVEVPEDFGDAGWWVQTRRPGEIGPAVIGGHVDSRSGPAVFHRLRDLRPGDEIIVHGEDGATRTFEVDQDPVQVDKHDRPPEVFGFTNARPELRLITCGGDFDPSIGHYTDNIVVFAHDPTHEA